jgi:hypothetical protein
MPYWAYGTRVFGIPGFYQIKGNPSGILGFRTLWYIQSSSFKIKDPLNNRNLQFGMYLIDVSHIHFIGICIAEVEDH